MKIQETLYLLVLGHGQMHVQRGVVCCMKGIILLIYIEHLIKIVGVSMKRLKVIQPNQTNITVSYDLEEMLYAGGE
jgi:hypothetical protein